MKRQWLIPFLPAAVLAYLLMCAMVDAPGCCSHEPFVFVPWHPWIALGVAATALTILSILMAILGRCPACVALESERDALRDALTK